MVPLKVLIDGGIHYIQEKQFTGGITELCEQHKNDNRALAFAFLIYDFENPQIIKILDDRDYWNALHHISGNLLSIYYIHSKEQIFAEDLEESSPIEQRGLFKGTTDEKYQFVVPILKRYFKLENNVKLPSVLFFQTNGGMVTDYFLVELKEEAVEKSFLELKSYIKAAVERLALIKEENYNNSEGIFENLKQGVGFERNKKIIFRSVKQFPVQLLLSWFAGKI